MCRLRPAKDLSQVLGAEHWTQNSSLISSLWHQQCYSGGLGESQSFRETCENHQPEEQASRPEAWVLNPALLRGLC